MTLFRLVRGALIAAISLCALPAGAEQVPENEADARYGAASVQRWSRLQAALAASRSPRDRILAIRISLTTDWKEDARRDASSGLVLRKAAEEAPSDRLVQYTWASAAARASGCDARHPCPDRAGAWATIEPDNAAAWQSVVGESLMANDEQATDEALSRMAAASRHEDLWGESVSAWREVLARFPLGASAGRPADVEVRDIATAAAFASVTTMGGLPWTRACNRAHAKSASASRLKDCGSIGRLMLHHGNNFSVRHGGYSILQASGNLLPEDRVVLRQVAWMREQHAHQFADLEVDSRWVRPYFDDIAATGDESLAVELSLQRAGIPIQPPEGWTSAYER